MKARIIPGRSEGSPVRIPSSKSLSHRVLIAASLAEGTSILKNLVDNNDIRATMNCLSLLGASFERISAQETAVKGITDFSFYDGSLIDCGESGSTLRFLIPLFSLCERTAVFTGHGKLMERPQTVYEDLFHQSGLLFEKKGGTLCVHGPLSAGEYTVRGDISSQFITGLLFTLPLLGGSSALRILPPYESRSYVGLTEDVLELAGISVGDEGMRITVPGSGRYRSFVCDVEGDDSQAAFFAVLAMISQKPVTVYGMRRQSRQGDHVIVELIERFGGRSIPVEKGYRFEPGRCRACTVDLADCPDLGPALFALAAVSEGTTVFTHCGRLRIKESDRIQAMKEELETLGVAIEEEAETVRITGVSSIRGNVCLSCHNDHRIAMALSMLASGADAPIELDGCEAVNKSYPDFFQDYLTAGGRVELI